MILILHTPKRDGNSPIAGKLAAPRHHLVQIDMYFISFNVLHIQVITPEQIFLITLVHLLLFLEVLPYDRSSGLHHLSL